MAANNNLVLQLLITARDQASTVFSNLFGFLDKTTSATANLIREKFTDLFGGGLDGAIEFEAQLDRVAAKGGYTQAEVEKLKASASALGAQFGISGTDAARGMESLAAAGLSANEAIATLPQVLALASAEQISADAAAEKLIDSLSIMGLGFEEAGRLADVLAKGANITTSSASQLAEALSEAGGVAKAAGLDLEVTVAALDLLHKNGIKGSEAGTALKAILTALLDPASKASTELDALGITSRDLGTVMGELKGRGDAASTAILAFGTEAGPGLRALIGEGQEGLNDYTTQLRNAEGAAALAAEEMGGNLKSALAALASGWESLKAALLDPLLAPITKQVKDLAAAFQEGLSSDKFKDVQETIRQFGEATAQAIGDFIRSFDFNGALNAVASFATSAKAHFSDLSQAANVAAGVVQLAWNGVTATFQTLGAGMTTVVASIVATLANIEEAASKVGLGSVQRANELRATALNLQRTATGLLAGAGQSADAMGAAFDRMTAKTEQAKTAVNQLKTAVDQLPADAATLTPIIRTLEDYKVALDNAKVAQAQAAQAASDAEADYLLAGQAMDAGTGSAYRYEEAAKANRAAQLNLKAAQAEVIAASADYTLATQEAIRGIDAESVAASRLIASKKDIYAENQRANAIRQDIAAAYAENANAAVAVAQAELELAQAKGDAQAISEASLTLAEKELVALQAKRIEQEKALQQVQLLAARIDDLTRRKEVLTGAEQAELAELQKKYPAIQQVVAARQQELAAIDTKIQEQERERAEAERMASAIGQLTRLYQEQADEHQRSADARERYVDMQLREIEGSIRVAIAKGDELEVARLQAEQQQVLIEQAEQIAANRAQEATDAQNAVNAKTLELLADGELSKADRQQIADLQALADQKKITAQEALNHADALRKEAEAGRELPSVWEDANQRIQRMAKASDEAVKASAANAKAAGDVVSGFYNASISVLSSLSEGAVAEFKRMRGEIVPTGDALDVVRQRIDQTEQALGRMGTSGDTTAAYLSQITRDANEVQKAFLGQAEATERFIEQLNQVGQGGQFAGEGLETLIRQAQESKEQFKLLDDSRLDQLQAAIDAANDKLREMQEETQSARDRLAELNAEILEEQGQGQQAELLRQQLDYQQQLAELEAQRQAATMTGNRELLELLGQQESKLTELNRLKVANIQADATGTEGVDQATRKMTAFAQASAQASAAVAETRNQLGALGSADLGNVLGQFDALRQNVQTVNDLL